MKIPKMIDILLNPEVLLKFIMNGGKIFKDKYIYYMFDGTYNNKMELLDIELFKILYGYSVISIECGNFESDEKTFGFNKLSFDTDFYIRRINNGVDEIKYKYNNEYRKYKLKNILDLE